MTETLFDKYIHPFLTNSGMTDEDQGKLSYVLLRLILTELTQRLLASLSAEQVKTFEADILQCQTDEEKATLLQKTFEFNSEAKQIILNYFNKELPVFLEEFTAQK